MSDLRSASLTVAHLIGALSLLPTMFWPLGLAALFLWFIMLARSAYVTGRVV